jgi:hypothetical protein
MSWELRRDDPRHPGHREHRPRAKKDTRAWCKGKVGRPHQPVVQTYPHDSIPCREAPSWYARRYGNWWCRHQLVCEVCGKVLEFVLTSRECPDRPAARGA